MGTDRLDPGLMRALQGLSAFSLRAPAAAPQREAAKAWARPAVEAIVAATPAFNAAARADLRADLEHHVGAYLNGLCRLIDGAAAPDIDFVRVWARQCAAERLPIDATLQAYRCLQPLLSRWLQDEYVARKVRDREPASLALAECAAQYTAAISIEFSAAYAAQSSVYAEAEGDRRAELLGILVGGFDESDARIARLLKRAGYLEQRLRFCVALVQATDPLEMENTARVRRMADAVVDCVAPLSVRVLVGVRSNLVTAVFSDTRRLSGWTAPQADLADRVKERLLGLGPAVLVGLSGEQASPAQIPRGLHEATVALDFASVGERVVAFYSLSIRRLLIHRGVEYVRSALPPWFAMLRDADAKAQGELVRTLRALADADMNVQAAARGLQVHPNTLYGRIQRIQDLTGLSAQRYHDLTHLLLAADCGGL